LEKGKEKEGDNVDIEGVIDLTNEEDDVLDLNIPEEKRTKTDKDAEEELKDGIFITNDTAAFTGGNINSSIVINISYRIIPVSGA
jgi:hypothetical protein